MERRDSDSSQLVLLRLARAAELGLGYERARTVDSKASSRKGATSRTLGCPTSPSGKSCSSRRTVDYLLLRRRTASSRSSTAPPSGDALRAFASSNDPRIV